jgi:hypothetical protein
MAILDTIREGVANPLVAFMAGVAVTWLLAWLYYRLSGRDLKRTADRLDKAVDEVARILEIESTGAKARRIRDEAGNPTGGVATTVTFIDSIAVSASIVGGELSAVDEPLPKR